ncbi:gp53-like domain-containing protein [Enterobacter asburiae]|uniref:gp53-like domain-containing protein n=1 Tax=Enterobacter asburiae TaxID=61645 RepID=UPI0015E9D6E7|nr:phage tail protein [Enterobacter asburiae]QLR29172.1 phage tail protein [Enterobacter asburiae]
MANLPETPQWEDGIYQIEVSDPVLGGPDGITNRPLKQLASRTAFLKQRVETGDNNLADHIKAADPHSQYAKKDSPVLTGSPTTPTVTKSDNSLKIANTQHVKSVVADFAPLQSPIFTGEPLSPDTHTGNYGQQIANTKFVRDLLSQLVVGDAPANLNTLSKIAKALDNDSAFATTMIAALGSKAPLDSPRLTGMPTAPTAIQNANNTQIATTAFVKAAIAALVDSSPEALDTLNELAAALGNDPNFATTMTNALAGKQPLDPTLTALSGKNIPALIAYLSLGTASKKDVGTGNGQLPDMSSFTGSAATTGWQPLPNGFIMQWGQVSTVAGSLVAVPFPIPFPRNVFQIVGSCMDINNPNIVAINSTDKINLNVVAWVAALSGGAVIRTQTPVKWFAIGN